MYVCMCVLCSCWGLRVRRQWPAVSRNNRRNDEMIGKEQELIVEDQSRTLGLQLHFALTTHFSQKAAPEILPGLAAA